MADAIPVTAPGKAEVAPKKVDKKVPDDFKSLRDEAEKAGKAAFLVHGSEKAEPALRVDH